VAIGDSSLYNNGTGATSSFQGSWNTAAGSKALFSNTIGYANTGVGYNTLDSNTTGAQNTAVGTDALYFNKAGSNNTAMGPYALFRNSSGNSNTAIGEESLSSNTTADNNSALGYLALNSNTTGSGNTALGASALLFNTTGSLNTASGANSLYSNTTGLGNTASGDYSLYNNSTGYYNTASGFFSLESNTTGTVNTASGVFSLYNNTTGYSNTATGMSALDSNSTGYRNTATGDSSLFRNMTGYNNTASGYNSLLSNTTGYNNTAFGNSAGSSYNGFANTLIGATTDITADGLSNATALGYAAFVDASNKVRIGNTLVTSIGGQVGWTTFSDGRFKKNIKQNVQGLAFINSLHPITYTVDVNSLNAYYDKGKKREGTNDKPDAQMKDATDKASKIIYSGFIAQDVEKAADKLNYHFSGVDKPQMQDGLYGLRYSDFVVPLVKAVQELSQRNDSLQSENDDLKKRFEELKSLVLAMQQKQEACSPCNQLTTNTRPGVIGDQLSVMSGALLQQNIPNPFSNTTTINYTLPQKFTSAQIVITDKSGRTLKAINLPAGRQGISGNKGNVKVDASTLASGTYQYSLMIDGKLAATKQMVITK
jgi:hypothetical protein